jgi:hypothetical protein
MRLTSVCCALLLASAGCSTPQEETRPVSPPREYEEGRCLVWRSVSNIYCVIRQDHIADWMEAMAMEFPVKSDEEVRRLSRGDWITATVFVEDLDWIGNIRAKAKGVR